jgi:hypothetical protein
VCNANGLKSFARNAAEKAAVLAASALIAGVSAPEGCFGALGEGNCLI